MKIIGTTESAPTDRTYIAEITHSEIEKAVGKYYGKLQPLEPGDEIEMYIPYDLQFALKMVKGDIEPLVRNIKNLIEKLDKIGGSINEQEAGS